MSDQIPLSTPPVVDTAPAPAGDGAPKPPASVGAPKNKGGRRSTAEEVDAYLAKNGLVAVPTAGAGPAPAPWPLAAPVADAEPFDEAATRAGIEGLVKSASGIAVWTVGSKAAEITGSEKDGERFGEAAAMPEPTQKLVIESGVAWARKTGTNVGPELGVFAGLGGWVVQLRGIVSDLREIAASKRQAEAVAPKPAANAPST